MYDKPLAAHVLKFIKNKGEDMIHCHGESAE
jgi:hypothetical protein